MNKFLFPIIGLVLGAIIAFVLSMVPGFVSSAYACGGWWDPCCPWWEPQRCEAFNANKKKVGAENEAYFQRWEERLGNLNRVIGLLPVGSFPGWVISQAKDAAKAAKEANGAVARGGDPQFMLEIDAVAYDETGYEWVNKLADDAAYLSAYGNYAADQSYQFTLCMQSGGEGACQVHKDYANWGLWHFGDWHGEMAYTDDVLAYQLEYWYGGAYAEIAEGALILREMANVGRNTEAALQQ